MFDRQAALDRIYNGKTKVNNLKIFPGTERDASQDKALEQINRVISEIDNNALEIIEPED